MSISLEDFSQNGVVTLIFSEEIYPIEHFWEKEINLTSLNENISDVVPILYVCMGKLD
jgi:hypothetical protein